MFRFHFLNISILFFFEFKKIVFLWGVKTRGWFEHCEDFEGIKVGSWHEPNRQWKLPRSVLIWPQSMWVQESGDCTKWEKNTGCPKSYDTARCPAWYSVIVQPCSTVADLMKPGLTTSTTSITSTTSTTSTGGCLPQKISEAFSDSGHLGALMARQLPQLPAQPKASRAGGPMEKKRESTDQVIRLSVTVNTLSFCQRSRLSSQVAFWCVQSRQSAAEIFQFRGGKVLVPLDFIELVA